jgi:hypothetical protein
MKAGDFEIGFPGALFVFFFLRTLPGRCRVSPDFSAGAGREMNYQPGPNHMDRRILEDLRRIEFQEIHYNRPERNYFGFIRGDIPVLISAPHGAVHFRTKENRWKGEDEYTAALAVELGRLTGAYVVYLKNRAWEDPNNDDETLYKDFIRKVVKDCGIKFLIDLHGADRVHGFKIDVGTIRDTPPDCSCFGFKTIIRKAFSGFEKRVFNQRFHAARPWTITSFAWKQLGVKAAQFEISTDYRIVERKPDSTKAKADPNAEFRADGEKVLTLVSRLEWMIREIARKIETSTQACPPPLPPNHG